MKKSQLLLGAAALAFATVASAQVQRPNTSDQGKPSMPSSMPSHATNGAMGNDDAYYSHAWKAMDANGDGRVSRDEYLAYHGGRWDRYDTGKRGYFMQDDGRRLVLEREMSKTDGNPAGSATPKK